MRLVCISDTHEFHDRVELPLGDVLVHAGDVSSLGTFGEVARFVEWFRDQPHPYKLVVAGNHDFLFEREPGLANALIEPAEEVWYLRDSAVTIDGVQFWGAPWTPWFHAWAFNVERGAALAEKWVRIPEDTQVLITHGPPFGILDKAHNAGPSLGCEELAKRLTQLPNLRLHVFGHIHGGYGVQRTGITFVNASICTEGYHPLNAPIVIDLPL